MTGWGISCRIRGICRRRIDMRRCKIPVVPSGEGRA
jgi:hypothetical protein